MFFSCLKMNFWSAPLRTLQSLLLGKAPHLRQIRHWHAASLDRTVDLDVYLPPDYHTDGKRRYPLLIINDGQDLPVMRLQDMLEHLYKKEDLPYCIIVGVYASVERMREYGTCRQADYKGRGDKAVLYREFILQELLPLLHKRFRLDGSPDRMGIAGFSLGGLSAFDLAWAFPQIFGAVGVFSGSFWWRWSPVDPQDPDADRIMHDIVGRSADVPSVQRYWFECGTHDETDDRNGNGVIDSIDDTLDLIKSLRAKGVADSRIRYLEIPEGEHNPGTWAVAMPDFLRWWLQE
jgi:enterochelin esterase-like enzyme